MIMSMTGYGKKETQWEDKRISIEIRALNSKNADVNLRTPSYTRELDTEIRKRIAAKMNRGKIDLNIHIEFNGQNAPTKINTQIVKSYMDQLEVFGDTTLSERLALAMRLPDTLNSDRDSLNDEEKKVIFELLDTVIKDINSYRADEGKSLEKDFILRIDLIESHLEALKKIEPERNQKIELKLREALADLKIEIDANRFEQELIFYLEKFDITEEKVRLKNHLDYFKKIMKSEAPVGKKLGFIAQELGREINTIGSKANHSELQKIVVQMKDELEKIKEQLLNVL
ncbi:MAG: YicC family protein [Flavobacteriaceae bacterium]|nr:YicC family protein [Flavobacteriaceae bacterium]MDG2386590.1 YicC family protein [Flavobacteriaceae bacterium]